MFAAAFTVQAWAWFLVCEGCSLVITTHHHHHPVSQHHFSVGSSAIAIAHCPLLSSELQELPWLLLVPQLRIPLGAFRKDSWSSVWSRWHLCKTLGSYLVISPFAIMGHKGDSNNNNLTMETFSGRGFQRNFHFHPHQHCHAGFQVQPWNWPKEGSGQNTLSTWNSIKYSFYFNTFCLFIVVVIIVIAQVIALVFKVVASVCLSLDFFLSTSCQHHWWRPWQCFAFLWAVCIVEFC